MEVMNNVRDFKALFQRYYKPLCIYALHYLMDVQAAEDVVQDVFVSFWEKEAGAAVNARSLLYVMTRNRCIDLIRRSKGIEIVLPEDSSGAISDEDAVNRSEIESKLWQAVAKLPAGRQELLLMSKRDGLTYQQIASAKGLSVNTVRNQISRALKALRAERDRIIDFVLFFFSIPAF